METTNKITNNIKDQSRWQITNHLSKESDKNRREVLKVKLAEEVVDPDDIEMLEDLIVAATNEALRKVNEATGAVVNNLTGGMGGGLF